MLRQYVGWLGLVLAATVCLASCGAMTIEPAMADEPIAKPIVAPRLMRRDAGVGIDGGEASESDH